MLIEGGKGDDTISFTGNSNNNVIVYNVGDGNDLITGFRTDSTLKIGNGNDTFSAQQSGSDLIVTVGEGKITLKGVANRGSTNDGAADLSSLNILVNDRKVIFVTGSNYYENRQSDVVLVGNDSANYIGIEDKGGTIKNVTILANDGNDSIYTDWQPKVSNISIDGGAGNDIIYTNDVSYMTIEGGDGKDTIDIRGEYSTVNGGAGDDSIANHNYKANISGGDGNDIIRNWSSNATINGGAGDDNVSLRQGYSSNVLIVYNDGDGNDIIYGFNETSTLSIAGSGYISTKSGNNLIVNVGNGRINLVGAANLSPVNIVETPLNITNDKSNITILGTNSNDTITNNSEKVTVLARGGNDSITNNGTSSNIDAGDGNDTISTAANHASVNAGAGNDSIYNGGYKAVIDAGDGSNTIESNGTGSTILAGKGNDSINNRQSNVMISTGDGNDSISNSKATVTIDAGGGNDIINSNGTNTSIKGGAGSDTVINSGDNATISGGAGNDSISLGKASGNLVLYNKGDGSDVIVGFTEKSSVSIGGAAYASAKLGDNAYIKVGDNLTTIRGGSDLATLNIIGTVDQSKNFSNTLDNNMVIGNGLDNNINNTGKNTTILANSGKDSVYNTGDNVKIYGGDGDDTLLNDYPGAPAAGSSVLLDGGNGNDYIDNDGKNSTVLGGAGKDSIHNYGSNSLIDAGTDNDTIRNYNESSGSTIRGGKGNDYIWNDGAKTVFKYELGDGDDVIEGFKADSTLDINGANYATEKSGSDLLVYIGDGSEITLKGAASFSRINIRGEEDKSKNLKNDKADTSMVGSNYADTLENSGKNVTIMGNAGSDLLKNSGENSSVDGSRGNDTIENRGTMSIIEGGLGNDSIFNNRGDKSLIEGGAGDDTINNKAGNTTIFGGEGNDSLYNGDYGNNSTLDGGAGNDIIRNTVSKVSLIGGAGNDTIDNSDNRDNNNVTINAGTGDDSIKNDSQNILFQYKNGDGNDVITGFNATSTLSIDGGVRDKSPLSSLGGTQAITTKSGSDIIVSVGSGKVTLKDAANLSTVNIVEVPLTINNDISNATVYGTNADDTVINTGEKVAIFALGGKDSLDNNAVNVTIDGGADDDYINNTGKKTTLIGQSGNDTIKNNEADNVSIAGGEGNDSLFNHGEEVSIAGGEGNDTIENSTNSHKALIDGGTGADSLNSYSSHNVTIKGGAGNDTIVNNTGTASSIEGGDDNDLININGSPQNTIIAGRGDDTINVDWSSNNALIIYNAGNGTTINPGDGNDLITGFNSTSTLQIGDGTKDTYRTEIVGDDVIVTITDSKVTIKGGAKLTNVNIVGLTKRIINNIDSKVELLGGDLNDSIVNTGFDVTIKAFAGNDTIQNYTRENTIDAGADNDYIENKNTNHVTITGGTGNDAIVSRGGFRNIITGGKGDDSIDVLRSREVLIKYKAGDGNDYIEGFDEYSSISIGGGVYTTAESNRDIVITVNENTITLNSAASLPALNIIGVEDVHLNVVNRDDNASIYGTMFEDTVGNIGTNVTILTQDGNDSIHNGYWNDRCSNVTIDAGKGDDTIFNDGGSTVSVIAGEGNDYVENNSSDVTISGDEGNDTIRNTENGINTTINAGAGNDSIDNIASNTTIEGGTGNDTIYNNWDIQKGTQGDSLNDNGSNVIFVYNAGDGNDIIYGFKYNSTLSIAGGEYTSAKSGKDIIVTVGDGKVTLKNAVDLKKANIVREAPLNINNTIDNTLIVGTAFKDTIGNSGTNVTIQALGDNDSINNSGASSIIDLGKGNDSITNSGANSNINAGDGNDSITNTGSNSIIYLGAGNDYISNKSTNSTILGGEGNDSIRLEKGARNSLIELGAGRDSIFNDEGGASTIDGGADDDYIRDYSASTSINGGAGNDVLNLTGNHTTAKGGAGNDTLNLNFNYGGNVIEYNTGDGDDVINGLKDNTTLKIDGGTGTYSPIKSGNDLILTIGDGHITLKGAATLSTVNITGDPIINVETSVDNSYSNVSIIGNDSANTINNQRIATNVTILGNGGNDSVYNLGDNAKIYGGDGNDTLYNDNPGDPVAGASVLLKGGNGNDVFSNDGANSSISGGVGDDSIQNTGDNVTIEGGAGNDSIRNEVSGAPAGGKKVSISGGEGSDYFANDGDNATINGGVGNDTVQNWGATSKIEGGAGDDSINNEGNNVTINAGDGNDTVTQERRNNVSIAGGAGNDYVFNAYNSTNITIDAGAGNDTIDNDSSKLSLSAGEGDDSISLYSGEDITVIGGKGSDSIFNNTASKVLYQYKAGDGNDYISGFKADSTLQIGNGSDTYSTQTSGSDLIVTVGDGKISLVGAANLSTVNIAGTFAIPTINVQTSLDNNQSDVVLVGNDSANYIENSGKNVTILANGSNDSIINTKNGTNVSLNSGTGDDSIRNIADNVTIDSGAGNDSIDNYYGVNSVTINTGAGEDVLSNSGSKVSINTGADNDLVVYNSGSQVTIDSGTGNDTIYNRGNNNSISGGDDNDYIENQSDGNSVTLNGGKGDDTIVNYWDIKAGKAYPNNNYGLNALFQYKEGDGNDSIVGFKENSTLQIGNGTTDTYSTQKSGNDIIVSVGDGDITLTGAANLSTVNIAGTFAIPTINVIGIDYANNKRSDVVLVGDYSDNIIRNAGSNVTILANGGYDTVRNAKGAAHALIELGAGNDSVFNDEGGSSTIDGGADNDYIKDYSAGTSIDGGAGNDVLDLTGNHTTAKGGAGNDTLNLKFNYGGNVIEYNTGDGDDVINGLKDNTTLEIDGGTGAYSSTKSGNDIIVTVGEGKISLVGAAALSTVNIAGKVGTFIDKNYNNGQSNVLLVGNDSNNSIRNTGSNVTILANGGNDTIFNSDFGGGGNKVTIDCGAGNDSVLNYNSTVSIAGGEGSDTVWSRTATYSTISVGAGDDSIRHDRFGDNSKLYGDEGNDYIYNESSTVTISGGEGDDHIYSCGFLDIDSDYNVMNSIGTNIVINGDDGNDFIEINNSSNVTINGGAGDDTIGNNWRFNYNIPDTENGGGSNLLFQYNAGDGNDVIYGFNTTSTLSITGASYYASAKSGDDVIVMVDGGNITLKGAATLSTVNIATGTAIKGIGIDKNIENNQSNVVLVGNDSANNILNFGDNATILSNGGDDTIDSRRSYSSILAGAGNDSISNVGSNSTINGDDGNDDIFKNGKNSQVDGGAGNDTINNRGGNNTLAGGEGDDFIWITSSDSDNTSISGGAGNDSIRNISSNVTINGGAGDDTITNDSSSYGKNILIQYNSGDGNDLINGFKDNSTLQIGDGTDTYASQKSGNDIIVSVGEGNITLTGAANLSTVNIAGVAGTPTINVTGNYENNQSNVLLVGNDSDNSIRNSGENVTILANGGKDRIYNYASNVTLMGGAEDDYLFNGKSNSNASIDAGTGNDSVWNEGANSSINTGDGDDTVYNIGSGVSISGGAGKDSIRNLYSASNITIDGGADNDYISSAAPSVKINGGTGDDYIYLGINASNDVIKYNVGDGNDTIEGFRADSTLQIGDGTATYSSQRSGNDIIVTVGEGKITLTGAAALSTLNIAGEELALYTVNTANNVSIFGTNKGDSIYNRGYNVMIQAQDGDDYIYNRAYYYYELYTTIFSGAGNDTVTNIANLVTIYAGEGNDTIYNGGFGVLVDAGDGDNYIYSNGSGSTILAGKGNDSINNRQSNVMISAGDGKDSISNSMATVTIDAGAGDDSIANTGDNVTIEGGAGNDTLWNEVSGNSSAGKQVSLNGGEGADYIANDGDNSTLLGGADNDTIQNWGANVTIQAQDGDDSINNTGDNVTIEGGAGNDTLWNEVSGNSSAGKQVSLNGGEGADYIANDGDNSTLLGGADNDTIQNWGANVTIQAQDGDDSINNTGDNVTIEGGAGNDIISLDGSGQNNLVNGGAGDDTIENQSHNSTINGGSGDDSISNLRHGSLTAINADDGDDFIYNAGDNVTITGGTGDDSIYINWDFNNNKPFADNDGKNVLVNYNAGDGNDVIYGFRADSTLKIGDGTATYSSQRSGDDIILTVGYEKITLKGAATLSTVNIAGEAVPLKINVNSTINNTLSNVLIVGNDSDNSIRNSGENVTILGNGGNDSIVNYGLSAIIDAGEGNDSIYNAQNAADYSTINSGAGNDYINNGGYKAVIDAGEGDDSIELSWSSNNALIKYNKGDGNDVITGFNATSTLSIAGAGYNSVKSGNDLIFTVGDGKITLKGAAKLSTVNIAGAEYKPLDTVNYDDNVSIVGTQFDDTIENYGSNVTILANEDNDSIMNKALDTSILGGAGDDTIANIGSKATILAEEGNDSINNYGKFSKIDTGEGDDIIENSQWGNSALISGGDGNDTIRNWAVNTTIEGGKGDDSIVNYSVGVLYNYTSGDGNDVIEGFNASSSLSISGGIYKLERTDSDIIVIVGEESITLKGAATLSAPNIFGEQDISDHYIENDKDDVIVRGTEENDTIDNYGSNVTILALGGDDSINNEGGGTSVIIDAGAGNDTIENNYVEWVTIDAGEGNDYIFDNANDVTITGGAGNDTVNIDFGLAISIDAGEGNDSILTNAANNTIIGGKGNDTITLDYADTMLILYTPGDGNDLIQGFKEDSTLSIGSSRFSSIINGDDVIVTVGKGNITLEGAALVYPRNIIGTKEGGSYVIFTVANSEVTYETDIAEAIIKKTYQFKKDSSLLSLNNLLKDYIVTVKNKEEESVKVNWHYGSASLSSDSTIEYLFEDETNYMTLTSANYGDKLNFDEDANVNYGDITTALINGSAFSTKSENAISFDNGSSADITAPEGSQIDIGTGTFTFNNLHVNSTNGAGTITVEDDGLGFKGYGVQFVDLEIAKESYFGKVTPMVVTYKISDKSYEIQNTACVKTLAHDFTKITLSFQDDTRNVSRNNEKYAYYKVNGKEFLAANDADNINVIEAKDSKFKIQGKEVETENITRITIDEQISFTGTEIDFDDVKVNYAQGNTVSYTLDGKEVTINKAATVITKGDTKTFKCAAGSYLVNGRNFETSADLTFTADANEIKIPLNDAKAEIYFDGVKVSGVSDGGELVFDLANEKTFVPNGAIINVYSSNAVKLNLVAGSFTVNDNEISSAVGLEITADKDNIKVPLSENAVTINSAKITGTDNATIDKQKMIALPNGALVENISENIFKLTEKNSAASFGNANKKVVLTDDDTAYIKYAYENVISVGLNSVIFENVEIYGNDAWTIETSGKNGIDKVKDITNGATISASTSEGFDGDLNFEVETEGNGTFTICGQKFISTGDAVNIFTVSKPFTESESELSEIAVTAITKKLGTVDGNFEKGIQVNPEDDEDKYVVKATNNDNDIEIALNTEGVMSIEKIADGANVEEYGQAEKVITVKNDKEYSLQISDYKYTVNGDLDDDGITFELVDGDFKVRTLYEDGLVTRYNVNDAEQLVWTWSIEQDKWIREEIVEVAPYEITVNADKTLTLKANDVLVKPYSSQVIASPKSGKAVENAITITTQAIDGTTTFINDSDSTPNVLVKGDDSDYQIITALAPNANVLVDKKSYTLNSENATGTTFKVDDTRQTLKITDDYKVTYSKYFNENMEVKLTSDNNDIELSDSAEVTAPEGKNINFAADALYMVNTISFNATAGTKAESVKRGIKFDLSTGKIKFDGLTLEGTGTAQITQYNPGLVILTDGAKVTAGQNKFKYFNRRFLFEGTVDIVGKKFESDEQVRGGFIYFETSEAEWDDDGNYTEKTTLTTGFVVENKYVEIQNSLYDSVKIVEGKISSVEGVKNLADIAGDGTANISIVTKGSGFFTIGGKEYKITGDKDGVTFVTDDSGNVAEVKGLDGTIEGNFENEISVNSKAIQITGASTIKVTTDGENITEIANVAGDLVTTDGKTYRKDVRIINAGGAEKLTTSADGTIIFNDKNFSTSAGKTFTLDSSGNVSEISSVTKVLAAYSEENVATINLTTTDGLDEVIGDFSEGLTVNGVFVRVTDSTNFIVKDDDEYIYIETTAADTFTINGKTFETKADKTIFKLDANGNVCEIVTDRFLPGEDAYLIDGDFNDEIIFNGKKFCVTGTNDASIFIGKETLIGVELARNAVKVVESGGAVEIAVNGNGDITIGDETFSTSNNFIGLLQADSDGKVYSSDYFSGTISGNLGGIDLTGLTIDSKDSFSVTSNGAKITAIENLSNGSFTCDELNSIAINGAKLNADNSEELKVAVKSGKLEVSNLANNALVSNSGDKVNFVTKESGEFFIGEDDFKVTGDDSVTFAADENGKVQAIYDLDANASVQTAFAGKFAVNSKTLTAKDEDIFVGLKSNSAKVLGASAEKILDSLGIDDSDDVIIIDDTTENKNITLSGGDVVIVEDISAKVNITASKGEDSIISQGKNVFVSLQGGKTTFFADWGGNMKIAGYNASTGSGFQTNYEDIHTAIEDGDISFDKDKLQVGSAIFEGDINGVANFFDADGELQKVGNVFQEESLNLSKEKADYILLANENSTLTAGAGNDSIFAKTGSQIDAGAGKNQISLDGNGDTTIILSGGKTTIDNFNATFDYGDRISLGATNHKFSYDGENISVKSGTARAFLQNISSEDDTARILTLTDGVETKTAIAQKGAIMSMGDDLADVYYGKKSGVDFTGYNETLNLDLSENFYGINRVTVGGGLNTLISSSRNETLTGNSDGITEFVFDKGNGRDLIQNFNFEEDKINVGTNAITDVRLTKAGNVRLKVGIGDDYLTLEDAQGKLFKINDVVALVDKNIAYDDAANYFVATARNATLTVGEEAEIWLDGTHGKTFAGDIRTLDASNSDGKNSLAGNDLDNTILAGNGDASLWGGNGGNDLLIGGKGKNTFFYLQGNGNDSIQSANDGDIVVLSDISLEQISGTSITADGVAISFVDGATLQVTGNSDVTYQLADGSKFSANHEQAVWITK